MFKATAAATQLSEFWIEVGGVSIDCLRGGRGRPILFLHPAVGREGAATALGLLARDGDLIVPSRPDFGPSPRPWCARTVDDLADRYLDLMEACNLQNVALIGVSFGAWI